MEDNIEEELNNLQEEIEQFITKKLTVEECKKVRNAIQIAKNCVWSYQRNRERLEYYTEKCTENYNQFCEEEKRKEKWKEAYNEVCEKYAKLEINYDLANAKIKLLEGEKKCKNINLEEKE